METMHRGTLRVSSRIVPMAPQAGPIISMILRPLRSLPSRFTRLSENFPVSGMEKIPAIPIIR